MSSQNPTSSNPSTASNPFAPPFHVYEFSGAGQRARQQLPHHLNPFGEAARNSYSSHSGLSDPSQVQVRLASKYDFTSRSAGGWQATHQEGTRPPRPNAVVTDMCDCDSDTCLLHDVPTEIAHSAHVAQFTGSVLSILRGAAQASRQPASQQPSTSGVQPSEQASEEKGSTKDA